MAILNSLFGNTRKTGFQNPFASMTSPVGTLPATMPVPTVGTMPNIAPIPTVGTMPALAPRPLPRGITTLPAVTQGVQPSILAQLFGNRNPFPNAWQGGGWGNQGAGGGNMDWLSQLFGRLRG